ncbi:MAG: ornithine--oxo-acid transaminase [Calditrichaeota bacterium]|nr:MAG: ornithine--oxo-acid transaminase [Calditrichota bacterium]
MTQVAAENITRKYIELEEHYGAHNYHPLDIVIERAEGVWVYDVEGRKYMDFLSAYSAVNQGHCHPRILKALTEQAAKVTLTSRAFRNDQLGALYKQLCTLTGMEKVLPMNSGAEAVETAIKAARKWGYTVKGIPADKAEIIVCANNFHGRTTTIVGFSTEEQYKEGFGPFTPGFKVVPFGDIDALRAAVTPHTAAFIFEPIQGEGGILMPPEGFLEQAQTVCRANNVLFVADEIQTGLGRTGKMFAWQHELDEQPDMLIIGKALSGGFYPVSAVLSSREVMDVFRPGDHGSTFGGNPLAAAVARAALDVIVDEQLADRSAQLGRYLMNRLNTLSSPKIREIRGRGLFIGIELNEKARPYCEALKEKGLLVKETHENVIRLAPPLVISEEELDWAFDLVRSVL